MLRLVRAGLVNTPITGVAEGLPAAEESAGIERIPLQRAALRDLAHRLSGCLSGRADSRPGGVG